MISKIFRWILQNGKNNIAYLSRIADKIKVHEDPSLKDIENDLNVAAGRRGDATKIKVYCEDSAGITFVKSLLPKSIKENIEFVTGMSLPWNIYRVLYQHKVPEFINNIIVLDGDVKREERGKGWKDCPSGKNIILLPTEFSPEQILYEMLYSLKPDDDFWNNELSGYSKDVCFRDYPNYLHDDSDSIKQWYRNQKEYAGRNYSKFINRWKKENPQEVEAFVDDFINAYNYVAARVGCSKI